jgi:hypothetical protein
MGVEQKGLNPRWIKHQRAAGPIDSDPLLERCEPEG